MSPTDDELARWRAAATEPPTRGLRAVRERAIEDARLADLAREAMLRLLDEVARLRALTLAVSIERDTIEVERDEARREAERLRIALRAAPLK